MAFSNSSLSIELTYDLTNSPKDFSLKDTTDYSSLTYSDIFGILRAVAPSVSQFYNNTSYASPDIDYNSSDESGPLASLPLVSGLVENGTYQFTYSSKVVDMLQSVTITSNDSGAKTFTLAGNYVSLINASTATAFNVVDVTTTAVTIVSASYSGTTGLTTVTINETLGVLTALAQFQWTVDVIFTKSFSQSYSYESPSVCLNWVSDDCCSSMTITDVTVYPEDTTVTRLHTVSYPVGITPPKADIESPLQELTISPIWTGTWTDVFTAEISSSNGIIVIVDLIRGVKEHKVSADEGLCQIYTCISNMATKYASYLTSAPNKALEMAKFINQASVAYMAYTIGKKCGKTDFEQYLTIITTIANECGCGCDCADCADGTPQQVVGCCENVGLSDFTILIESTNGSISVSSSTIGDTTTFDIEVDGTWLTNQINGVIATTEIGDLANVDDTTATPTTGQVLVWNNGTNKYERGDVQVYLTGLVDVDDTGLANNMVLYYDSGTSTFKFKLVTASISTLTDVTIVAIANGDILKYNSGTSKWENVDNFLSLLGDVNLARLADGNGIKWNAGTSKWIVFTPVTNINSLTDVFISSVADLDRFQYDTFINNWTNVPLPTFSASGVSYGVGFSGVLAGFQDFALALDTLTDEITIRGAIANGSGASASPVVVATIPVGFRPQATIPFICTVGSGGTNGMAFGDIDSATGDITIYRYYDATGTLTAGIPAGGILFSNPIKYYKTI